MVTRAVSNLFRDARVQQISHRGVYHIGFGEGDAYPERLLELIQTAPTLAAAVETKAKFIAGNNITFYENVLVGEKQLVGSLLNTFSYQISSLGAIAAHVRYNALGEIHEITPIPVELVRYKDNNLNSFVILPPDWLKSGHSGNKYAQTVYNEYNPDTVFEEIVRAGGIDNYKGQILYRWVSMNDSYIYPKASWHALLEDALAEAELKRAKYRDIYNGFSPRIKITEYTTNELSDEQKLRAIQNYETMLGSEGSGIIVEWALNKEAKTDFDTVQSPNLDKLYEYAEKSTFEAITKGFQIPQVLYGVPTAGKLGTSQEMQDAVSYVQKFVVSKEQKLIEKTLQDLLTKHVNFPNFNPELCKISNVSWL